MDPSNPDSWTKLATAFTNAPLWAVIMATGAIVGGAVWWFRGKMFETQIAGLKEQIAGLKEQIAVLEQRLKFAAEALAASTGAKNELEKQFQAYKTEVAAKGKDASPAKMDAAIQQLRREEAIRAVGLKVAQVARDGAQRQLDPKELKLLQDLVKQPFGRGMPEPK
jgi:chromosome segregation ATPase